MFEVVVLTLPEEKKQHFADVGVLKSMNLSSTQLIRICIKLKEVWCPSSPHFLFCHRINGLFPKEYAGIYKHCGDISKCKVFKSPSLVLAELWFIFPHNLRGREKTLIVDDDTHQTTKKTLPRSDWLPCNRSDDAFRRHLPFQVILRDCDCVHGNEPLQMPSTPLLWRPD